MGRQSSMTKRFNGLCCGESTEAELNYRRGKDSMGLFEAGALVWKVRKAIEGVTKTIKTVRELTTEISGLRQMAKSMRGKDLERQIYNAEEQRRQYFEKNKSLDPRNLIVESRNVIQKSQYFTEPLDVDNHRIREITLNPERYGMIKGQLLSEVRNIDVYKPSHVFVPFIFHDSNRDLIISEIPIQVIKYNLVHPWDTPLSIERLSKFGISSQVLMPKEKDVFDKLSKEDQIYFSNLYKDYHKLAINLGQADILDFSYFCHIVYNSREKLIRNMGAGAVLFELQVKTNSGKLSKVSLKPKVYKSL